MDMNSMNWLVSSDDPEADAQILKGYSVITSLIVCYYNILVQQQLPNDLIASLVLDHAHIIWANALTHAAVLPVGDKKTTA